MRAITLFSKFKATVLMLLTLWVGSITIGCLVYEHSDVDILSADIFTAGGMVYTFETILPTLAALGMTLLFAAIVVHPSCRVMRRSALMLLLLALYELATTCIVLPSYWDSYYTLHTDIYDITVWTDVAVATLALVCFVVFTAKLKRLFLTILAFFFSVFSLVGAIYTLMMTVLPLVSDSFWDDFITSSDYLSVYNIISVLVTLGLLSMTIYYFLLPSAVHRLAEPAGGVQGAASASGSDDATASASSEGVESTTSDVPVVPAMPETPKFPPALENKE